MQVPERKTLSKNKQVAEKRVAQSDSGIKAVVKAIVEEHGEFDERQQSDRKTETQTPLSIVITNFNGGDTLLDTVAACLQTELDDIEVIVIDDGSTDDSVVRVQKAFPQVRIVALGRNTRRLNVVRNAGIKAASHDHVMLMDNDVTFGPDVFPRLLEVLVSWPDAAAASPRLQYSDDNHAIYWDGGKLHYLGASVCTNRGAPPETLPRSPERNIGCGNVMLDRTKLAEIGYFDEDYWLGWADDGEIYYRLLAAGYECLHVSDVSGFHIAKTRTTERLGAQLHNRWMFMYKNYQLRTILLSLPVLVVVEFMQAGFCIVKGAGRDYFRSLGSVLREFPHIIKDRHRVVRKRVRGDKEILTTGPLYIASEHINKPMYWILSGSQVIFNSYWELMRHLL